MMNKEEIKFNHFKDIEELVQHLEMWYAEDDYYAYDRYFHLRDDIEEITYKPRKVQNAINALIRNQKKILERLDK